MLPRRKLPRLSIGSEPDVSSFAPPVSNFSDSHNVVIQHERNNAVGSISHEEGSVQSARDVEHACPAATNATGSLCDEAGALGTKDANDLRKLMQSVFEGKEGFPLHTCTTGKSSTAKRELNVTDPIKKGVGFSRGRRIQVAVFKKVGDLRVLEGWGSSVLNSWEEREEIDGKSGRLCGGGFVIAVAVESRILFVAGSSRVGVVRDAYYPDLKAVRRQMTLTLTSWENGAVTRAIVDAVRTIGNGRESGGGANAEYGLFKRASNFLVATKRRVQDFIHILPYWSWDHKWTALQCILWTPFLIPSVYMYMYCVAVMRRSVELPEFIWNVISNIRRERRLLWLYFNSLVPDWAAFWRESGHRPERVFLPRLWSVRLPSHSMRIRFRVTAGEGIRHEHHFLIQDDTWFQSIQSEEAMGRSSAAIVDRALDSLLQVDLRDGVGDGNKFDTTTCAICLDSLQGMTPGSSNDRLSTDENTPLLPETSARMSAESPETPETPENSKKPIYTDVRVLTCNHLFHRNCLRSWWLGRPLSDSRQCPVCRRVNPV